MEGSDNLVLIRISFVGGEELLYPIYQTVLCLVDLPIP